METIENILREMRKRCIDEQHSPELWGYVDRIEAAHKRELEDCALRVAPIVRAETKAEFQREAKKQAVTDCNHLNEIMEEANGIAESVTSDYIEKKARRICDLCKGITLQGNGAKKREALKALVQVIDECDHSSPLWWHDGAKGVEPLQRARAALSAPARNCDLPTVIANPHGAWLKDCDNWDEFGNPKKEIYEWLLAETKGENNESK